MPQYLFLFYDDPDEFRHLSPAEMQRIIERYKTWNDGLRKAGVYVASNKLRDDEGRVVRRTRGRTRVTDGPFSETKEVLGGYVLVEAPGYEQAIERLGDCPHLDYGTVVVREVESV